MKHAGCYPKDLKSLTGVRFFAALWVLLFHLRSFCEVDVDEYTGLFEKGFMGVDLFFILSGFILSHVYLPSWRDGTFQFKHFVAYRFARIWPLHAATLAVAAMMLGTLGVVGLLPDPVDWWQLPSIITMTHAWGVLDGLDFNDPSWSISAEWFAYLLFPLILSLIYFYEKRALKLFVAAILSYFIIRFAVAAYGAELEGLTYDFGIIRIVPEFMLGATLYLVGSRFRNELPRMTGLFTSVALLGALHYSMPNWILIILLALLIWILAESDKSNKQLFLTRPTVQYLGEISYAVYMTHAIVFYMYFGALYVVLGAEPGAVPVWLLFWPIPLVILASMVAYHFVERPARRKLRAVLAPKSGRQLAASTVGGA